MARLLFGVQGDALGHVNQAAAVAESMPQHEFLFLGGGKVSTLREMGYCTAETPLLATHYRDNRVDVPATVRSGIAGIFGLGTTLKRVEAIVKDFAPHLILTSYEFFAPLAARRLGIPCVSVNNQHFLTKCRYQAPKGQLAGRLMFSFALRCLHSLAEKYLVCAFFQFPPNDPSETAVFPPLLRAKIRNIIPSRGEHVLVYQTSPTFARLYRLLETTPGQFFIYGSGRKSSTGNCHYKEFSSDRFLEDLASCRYAITNGGHNVIAESLYYGKPVLSFPIANAYEQYFNAHMLAALGYGDYCMNPNPSPALITDFEKELDRFQARIAGGDFCGNEKLAERLEIILNSHGD